MRKAIDQAVRLLFKEDGFLLEADVAERAIASRLARHIALLFTEHDVDVEYNRHGLDQKAVTLPEGCRGGDQKRIFPDIVVHRRGHDADNLLAIQIKKETNQESRECDRAIILAMKDQLSYQHGLLIDLPAGPGAVTRAPRMEWL
jgi:hypothetical protein